MTGDCLASTTTSANLRLGKTWSCQPSRRTVDGVVLLSLSYRVVHQCILTRAVRSTSGSSSYRITDSPAASLLSQLQSQLVCSCCCSSLQPVCNVFSPASPKSSSTTWSGHLSRHRVSCDKYPTVNSVLVVLFVKTMAAGYTGFVCPTSQPPSGMLPLQGVAGSIPFQALVFFTLYFQLLGFSNFVASALMSGFLFATAFGGLLGGWIGDKSAPSPL